MTISELNNDLHEAYSTLCNLKRNEDKFDLDDIKMLIEGFQDTLDICFIYLGMLKGLSDDNCFDLKNDTEYYTLLKHHNYLKKDVKEISDKHSIFL